MNVSTSHAPTQPGSPLPTPDELERFGLVGQLDDLAHYEIDPGTEIAVLALILLKTDEERLAMGDRLKAGQCTREEYFEVLMRRNAVICRREQERCGGRLDAQSRYRIGLSFQRGTDGFPKSERSAVSFLRAAALHGHADAQLALAVALNASETARQPEESAMWYRCAAAQGNPMAKLIVEDAQLAGCKLIAAEAAEMRGQVGAMTKKYLPETSGNGPQQAVAPTTPDPALVLAQKMTERAGQLVAIAADHGMHLDFSAESIRQLDFLAKLQCEGILPQKTGDDRQKLLAGVAESLGAYLGETIRRTIGGRWSSPDGRSAILSLASADGSKTIALHPMQRAYKRLVNGEEDSFTSYYDYLVAADCRSASPD